MCLCVCVCVCVCGRSAGGAYVVAAVVEAEEGSGVFGDMFTVGADGMLVSKQILALRRALSRRAVPCRAVPHRIVSHRITPHRTALHCTVLHRTYRTY